MTPDSVHLLAQFIRHQRGLVTALEKWLSRQPVNETSKELSEVLGLFRQVLKAYETEVISVDVGEQNSRNSAGRNAPAFL